jgi:hypothetical protein
MSNGVVLSVEKLPGGGVDITLVCPDGKRVNVVTVEEADVQEDQVPVPSPRYRFSWERDE